MPASDKQVTITINAKDGTKAAFQQIASSSTQMGTAIQSASQKSSAAFDQLRQHAALVGSLLGSELVKGVEEFAAASQSEERAQRLLAQSVDNTGQSYEQYATRLESAAQNASKFGINANDATSILQILTTTTSSADAALNLFQVTMDVAAARHIDLQTAATLVGKAYDGDTTALIRYGIVLDKGATATEAITALQTRFAGQAEAGATKLSVFSAEMENFKAKIGGALGPISQYITLLPGITAGGQLLAAAGGTVIDMFRAQSAAAEAATVALQAETAAAGEAAVAGEAAGAAEGGLLATLTGPVGIIGALAAAGAALYLLTRNTDDYRSSADAAATDTAKLSAAIAALQAGGGSPDAVAALKSVSDEWVALDVAAAKYQETLALANQPLGQSADPNQPLFTGTNTDAYNAPILAARAAVAEMEKLAAISKKDEDQITADIGNIFAHPGIDKDAAKAAIDALFASFKAGTITADELAKGIDDLNRNWADYAVKAASADAATNALVDQVTKLKDLLTAGQEKSWWDRLDTQPVEDAITHIATSGDDLAKAAQHNVAHILDEVAAGTLDMDTAAAQILATNEIVIASEDAKTAAVQRNTYAIQENAKQVIPPPKQSQSRIEAGFAIPGPSSAHGDVPRTQDEITAALNRTHAAQAALDQSFADGDQALSQSIPLVNTLAREFGVASAQAQDLTRSVNPMAAALKTAAGYLETSGAVMSFLDALQHSTGDSRVAQISSDLSDVNSRLATETQIVIDNTNAIGQNSQQLADWATKLIGPAGTLAEIDDLYNKGAISLSTYNKAQEAGTRIFADNARVQQDMEVIQAKQAPLLADLADKQAKYMDQLANQPATVEQAALGWMDLGEQQKAQSIIALASSATSADAAQAIVDASTAADPYLASMLQQVGFLDKDHKVVLKEDGFKEVSDSIDNMTNALNVLIGLLNPSGKITLDSGLAQSDLDTFIKRIGDVPTDTNASVTANVNGLGDVYTLADAIAAVNSKDVYLNTFVATYSSDGTAIGGVGPHMLGGVIQRHAVGGVASILAEAGPEWLDFPGGGHAMAMTKGMYSVPDGTYVHTAPATKAMGAGNSRPVQNYYAPIYITPASGSMQDSLNQSALNRHRRA